MLARLCRAGGSNLLQTLKDGCLRSASQHCASSSSFQSIDFSCTLHSSRASAGTADSAALVTASSSNRHSLHSRLDSSIADRFQGLSRVPSTGSRTLTTEAPPASTGAGTVPLQASSSQQEPPSSQQGTSSASSGSERQEEQRLPFSSRLRPDQRPPPRRGFGGPDTPPAQDSGFQGRSRQLVNLKQRQAGVMSVLSTNNNTIITLSDMEGRVQAWASGGTLGFTNARKSTTHAAEAVAAHMGEKARQLGFTTVVVRVKGMGYGKQKAVRMLHSSGLRVTSIEERTPVPHNGCRLPRKRRT